MKRFASKKNKLLLCEQLLETTKLNLLLTLVAFLYMQLKLNFLDPSVCLNHPIVEKVRMIWKRKKISF